MDWLVDAAGGLEFIIVVEVLLVLAPTFDDIAWTCDDPGVLRDPVAQGFVSVRGLLVLSMSFSQATALFLLPALDSQNSTANSSDASRPNLKTLAISKNSSSAALKNERSRRRLSLEEYFT